MENGIICFKCKTEQLCPECHQDKFNRPLVVKHLDKEMPIIIATCKHCHVELFRATTYEQKTFHVNFCLTCAALIEASHTLYQAHRNQK